MHRLVVALTVLIGLVGAAVVAGYLFVFPAAADRAAAIVPANAAIYANVYLQPSTGQRMNLAGLLGRVPGFEDPSTLDDKVDQLVQNLLAETGLDYHAQVKPWLGTQIAIAAWAPEGDLTAPEPVLLVDVKDVEAAEESVASAVTEDGATIATQSHAGVEVHVAEGTAYAFVDEMLVIGPGAEAVSTVIDVNGGTPSLAGSDAYGRTLDLLPQDHLASVYVDFGAIAEAAGIADELSGLSTAGAALVAEQDGLHLAGSAPFAMSEAQPSSRAGFAMGGEPSSLPDWMPEETVGEVVLFGLSRMLENAEAAAAAAPEGEEIGSTLDSLRAIVAFGLGLDLDTDILPLLDREVGIAISGVEDDLPRGQLLIRPEDPEAAADAVDRLVDALANLGATPRTEEVDGAEITVLPVPDVGEIAFAQVNGIIIIGLAPEDVAASIVAHDSGRSLGSSDAYRQTFEVAGERAGNEGWVDVAAIVELGGDEVDLPTDARDILGQVGALGFTAPSRDDQIEFHAVLTIDEARPD
jgi:Protein of unknown function (DUF3352)